MHLHFSLLINDYELYGYAIKAHIGANQLHTAYILRTYERPSEAELSIIWDI